MKLVNMQRLLLVFFLSLGLPALGQSVETAIGIGTVVGSHLNGGVWPSFSLTGMFNQHVGIAGNFAARSSAPRNAYNAAGYHSKLADVNLDLRPSARRFTPELQLGYGAVMIRPPGYVQCAGVQCPANPSEWKSAAHLGLLTKINLSNAIFLRLEFHQMIGGNLVHPSRFAISMGYTFGRK